MNATERNAYRDTISKLLSYAPLDEDDVRWICLTPEGVKMFAVAVNAIPTLLNKLNELETP